MRKRIEKFFGQMTRLIYRRKIIALLLIAVFIGGIASNLPNVRVDTSTEGFLREDDPALIAYNNFRDQFGRDDLMLIAVKPPNVFDLKFLDKLAKFHKELESTLPYLDEVNSLVNARNTRGEKDALIVEDLLEDFPTDAASLALLKQRVIENPLYQNLLISEDGTFTTVIIKTSAYTGGENTDDALEGFDESFGDKPATESRVHTQKYLTVTENNEVVAAARKVIAKYNADDFRLAIAGSPVMISDLKETMMRNMRMFIISAIVIISIILFVMFRRISGVLLPMVVVVLSVISTVGLRWFFDLALKLPTQILPSFLLAVSVGDSVHILAIFYYRLHHGDNREDAIVYAIEHSGLAILMTSLTTAAGIGSFSTASVAPIADLGMFAAAGVMLALIYTVVLLPALIALFPISVGKEKKHAARNRIMDRLLIWAARISTSRPILVSAVSGLILVVSLALAAQLTPSHNPMVWLPDDMDVRQATELIDHNLKGTTTLEVIVDTGKVNGLYDPAILKKLDNLGREIESIDEGELFVGKTISLAVVIKEINRALNENRIDHYTIPDNHDLIAQEFLLFENSGSDDLEDFTDSQFQTARFTIKTPWLDAIVYSGFADKMESRFKAALGNDVSITITGIVSILTRTLTAAIHSAIQSYTIAIGVITLMMIWLVGGVRIGLIAMIPNLLPIIFVMGVMKLLNLPLDMFTMLVGSIAIGLAVDDTVHFMYNFRRYYAETGDVAEATRHTLLTTGRAMLVTTIVLSAGFFVFTLSEMKNLFSFGLITGLAIIAALLADFFLAPALMALYYRKHKPGSAPAKEGE